MRDVVSRTEKATIMKSETFSTETNTAWTKPLDKPVPYDVEYDAYETIDEVKSANDFPSDKEVIDFRNAQRKNNARQKAMNEALVAAGHVKPTTENDPQMRLKKMYQLFIDNKSTPAEARALASQALGIKWTD